MQVNLLSIAIYYDSNRYLAVSIRHKKGLCLNMSIILGLGLEKKTRARVIRVRAVATFLLNELA